MLPMCSPRLTLPVPPDRDPTRGDSSRVHPAEKDGSWANSNQGASRGIVALWGSPGAQSWRLALSEQSHPLLLPRFAADAGWLAAENNM